MAMPPRFPHLLLFLFTGKGHGDRGKHAGRDASQGRGELNGPL